MLSAAFGDILVASNEEGIEVDSREHPTPIKFPAMLLECGVLEARSSFVARQGLDRKLLNLKGAQGSRSLGLKTTSGSIKIGALNVEPKAVQITRTPVVGLLIGHHQKPIKFRLMRYKASTFGWVGRE